MAVIYVSDTYQKHWISYIVFLMLMCLTRICCCYDTARICCCYDTGGEYLYERPVSDDRWKKDEILEAKIKKFLSVSYRHVEVISILFSVAVIFEIEKNSCDVQNWALFILLVM